MTPFSFASAITWLANPGPLAALVLENVLFERLFKGTWTSEAIPTKSPCAACCPMWLIAVYNLAWEKQQPVLS